jgi:hypothetical protein
MVKPPGAVEAVIAAPGLEDAAAVRRGARGQWTLRGIDGRGRESGRSSRSRMRRMKMEG